MSAPLALRIPCSKCDASRGEPCGKPGGGFHAAREGEARREYRVALFRCPLHGWTTEVREGGSFDDDGVYAPRTECCAVGSTAPTDPCHVEVEGPFWATLDDAEACA